MFLMQLPRFEDWKYDDIAELIKVMQVKTVPEGTNLYNIGDTPEWFHIILKGAVFLETTFKTSKKVRFPIGFQEWETRTTTKTICYRVAELE
mmetsp:Transcript_2017/g.1815  ORF Transcript_2017/g.1815 Transcript_2017/m.1815 type:complete len:92 (+) Transcript_2017:223-498(+)